MTSLTPPPPPQPPRMAFFNYLTLALIVCCINTAASTNFNCRPGNGVDGFGGPYILDSSGTCDYMHVLTVSECKYATAYNAKNGIDSNDGFGHVADDPERPPGCYDCTTCFKESKQKYIFNSDLVIAFVKQNRAIHVQRVRIVLAESMQHVPSVP